MDATPNEIWKTVVGWEGHYEVSDQGRVRSLDRIVKARHGAWHKPGVTYSGTRRMKGRVLRPGASTSGHLHVVLRNPKKSRTIHAIVAEIFIGPRPNGMEIRHLNGNPADNRLVNLEYGTRSENSEDSKLHGTHFHAGKTHCKRGHPLVEGNLQKSASGRRFCLACRRDLYRRHQAGVRLVREGFCINGHPKTPENRYTNGSKSTRCKPCVIEKRKG